jgi:hypothetical protein
MLLIKVFLLNWVRCSTAVSQFYPYPIRTLYMPESLLSDLKAKDESTKSSDKGK